MSRPSRPKSQSRPLTPEPKTVAEPRTITAEAEGQRLWNQLTKGMDGIYRVAKDYVELELPGNPLAQLRNIHSDLGDLIRKIEQRQ